MEVLVYDKDAGAFSVNNQLMADRYEAENYEVDRDVHAAQDEMNKQDRYVRCARATVKLYRTTGLPLYNHMTDSALEGALSLIYGAGFVHPDQIKVLRSILPYNADFWENN